MRLRHKNAVVTGSSQGIGREIAVLLASEGANVVVNARGSGPTGGAAVAAVVNEIRAAGGNAVGCLGPVNDIGFAEELIETCVQTFGGIDILVNNAGTTGLGAVDRIDLATWHGVLDINLNGTFYCSRFAVRHMRARRYGRVLNCTSGAAFGSMGGAVYAASKSAVIGLTYGMAADLGMYGITTNAFNPQGRSRLSDQAEGGIAAFVSAQLRRGFCDEAEARFVSGMKPPDGVAPWAVYLCLDEASHINGRIFSVEGRRIALLVEGRETERTLFRDYDLHGPWSIDELRETAAWAFPIRNRWPALAEAEVLAIEAATAAILP